MSTDVDSGDQRRLRFVIIGAGMSGILSAVKLAEAGHHDVEIYEKADRVGGTWRENTYPGVACDVPSPLYSYSFEPNPTWSHRFSPGDEIRRYFEDVAQRYGVTDRIRFGEEIEHAEFIDGQWHLRTSRGRHDVADVVIAATGVLHHPNVPAIDGIDTFSGARFHSARWNHDVALDGRRIGIIGTGSTAIQMVSALVGRTAKVTLFQRTAQWIAPQDNPAYSEAEHSQFREHPEVLAAIRAEASATFADGFSNAVVDAGSERLALIEAVCLANLESNVTDPVLRAKLRPDYQAACKRLIISPDFYRSIQEPNAELVTESIVGVEPAGVRTSDGRLHELDVLVLATGFRADRFLRPIEVIGPDGVRLDDVWRDRPSAYLSISIPGFPNLFMLNGPNGPVGNFSLIEVAELQFAYIRQLVDQLQQGPHRQISASARATADFETERVEAAKHTVWATGCRSWYLDDRGIPAAWPWTFHRFREVMTAPNLADFDLV